MISGGDVTPVIDPTLTAVVWEITGLNDLKECIKNPNFGACTAFAISVLPVGKVKLLKKLGEGIEDIAQASRVAKKAKCFKCFLAGTKVLMADHSTKNIESVRAGDQVLATDPVSGRTGKRTVTDLIVTEHDKNFNELTIATPQGKRHLTATSEHPFWSPSQNSWTEAAHLRPGMTLRTVDGSAVMVKGNRSFSEDARTYNLTVDSLHTYYVLAGETPVLVHNSGECLRFIDGDIWDDAFEVSGKSVESMATVRVSGETLHLDGFMVFPKGTEGLGRAPVGPDALNQMKRALATRAQAEGYKTVVLNYERHIPKPDGTIFRRPGSMTLDVEKILAGG